MKFRFILLSFLLFSIGNSLNAQFIPFDNLCATCSPSPSSFSNQSSTALGIEPSFAIISQGIAVDLPLTYMMPQQFEVGPPISPIPITADVYFINLISINWGGIVGLSCTPDALTYDPDVNRFGCINICGTTNSAPGTYDVSVKVYAEGGAAGQTGGDTALVDFQVLILPPGNPYFTATPPESCQDTANIDLTVNENTFASLYDLNVYPTQYVWSLPYGNSANGATPPNFDIYSTESVTLTANRYEYIVTEVAVTSVNGNWWAGLFDDGAILGGSDPDLEFSMSNGSNSTSGGEVGNNFSPVWDLTSSPFSLTDQAISISFQENDLIGSDNGGTYTFTVNGSGNYNFGTSTSNIQGYVTIGTQLVDFIETTDTIKINPAPFVTNVSMSDSICQGDSILLSASASFTDFEWFNENGVLIDTTQTIFVKDEGAYYVKARVNSSALCKGTSNNYNIYTFPISTPVIAISSTGGLEIDNPNGYDIQWYSNGVPIPGAVTEELLDLSSGNPFSVTVTNANGCTTSSGNFTGCLGGYAAAPNGTDVDGDVATTFEAIGFSYNSQTEIAWSVTPVADGTIATAADVAAINNANVYQGNGNQIDLLLDCNTLQGEGAYYLTPFLIEAVDLPEFPFPYSDSTCIPSMSLDISFDCVNTAWEIGNASVLDPSGTPIDLLSLSPVPITYPIPSTLVCGALGGNIPGVNLFDIAPNSNPNGTWQIEVENSGTVAMDVTIPVFQVTLLASDCGDISTDMIYDYGPYNISIEAGETESISITVPPLPTNYPSIASSCSAFGTPVEIDVTNCVSAIEDLIEIEAINLYPNPNNGIFTLDFEMYESNTVEVSIIDISGRQVLNRNYANVHGQFSEKFDLKNNLNTGFYFMEIKVGNYTTQKKFIVK